MADDNMPSQWFTTASGNTTVGGGTSIAEGCAMANLNNAIRGVMAGVAGTLTFPSTAGNNTYTATLAPAIDAYNTGSFYALNFASSNTGTTPTLNLNAVGAKNLVRQDNSALVVGDLNGPHFLEYDGTSFRALNPVKASINGKVSLAQGGTNADLSATGGTSQVLQQTSTGSAVTVGQLASANLSDASSVVLSSSTGRLIRTGSGATSGGTVDVTFSSSFPSTCDGMVVTGSGASAIFFSNGVHASTATIGSSGGDGAFFYIAFGH